MNEIEVFFFMLKFLKVDPPTPTLSRHFHKCQVSHRVAIFLWQWLRLWRPSLGTRVERGYLVLACGICT